MKWKIVLSIIFILSLWGINNKHLNEVSKKEKFLQEKEIQLQAVLKKYDNKIIEYDKVVDLEKIRKELEEKGLKRTRYVEYFQVDSDDKE